MFAENGTRYLSCQCSATELQQLDNIHPSQSSLMSYTGDSKCLSCTPCSHTVCDVKTWLRVDKKLLDLFYNLALMRAILYFGFVFLFLFCFLPVCILYLFIFICHVYKSCHRLSHCQDLSSLGPSFSLLMIKGICVCVCVCSRAGLKLLHWYKSWHHADTWIDFNPNTGIFQMDRIYKKNKWF